MKNLFISLKTTVWTLLVLVCVFFIGSYMMPVHRELYAEMNDRLLFDWVKETAAGDPWSTWWFFAALAGLILLTTNTIVCSIQAVRGRWSRNDFVLRISPQIVHIGFLFILLAHLMGAGWGFRLSGALPEGARASIPENKVLYLQSVRGERDVSGFVKGWAADVRIFENGRQIAAGTLGPNRPLFHDGMGIYLKSFGFEPVPYAFLMVNRDPGAVWALVGAILFIAGSVTLLVLKWKKA